MIAPTVFISYSHRDEEWKDRVVTQLRVLEPEGLLDVWDDRRIEGGDEWRAEIDNALNAASVAVLLISANFLTSKFILDEEVPRLLERRAKEGVRVIPLIVKPCAWPQSKWLSPIQARPKDGRPLSAGDENQIESDLAALATEIAEIVKRAPRDMGTVHALPLPPDKIALAKMPVTDAYVIGRGEELKALDDAWNDPRVNSVSLVAWGGVGKTALVNKWLAQMQADNYRGAARVFGWSFYSQGAAEGRQVSADPFIAAALAWFGDPAMAVSSASAWDKGERLAELVKQSRTLLLLDGLEPLQNPPPVETGRIKDSALVALLRELARQNPGLVVITTRLAVDDLKDSLGSSAAQIDLENLSPEAGAAYLAHLGVDGTDDERKHAADDFGRHALALTLLGSYLKVVHSGDVCKHHEIPHLADDQKKGAHARRMMESYERWLKGKPELDILRVMGLFDRPAESGAMEALRKKPAIKGLTSKLQRLTTADWQFALDNLRDLRLLAPADADDPDALDCHPLLREHFGEKLQASNLKAWREGNNRLYEYYKSAAKELPETIAEMAPLFAAVLHGCQAGKHQDALYEVYWRRITRGSEFYCTKKLGAFGADLAALSGFFDPPWRKPVDGLSEADKGFVLNAAGFRLRALGRLAEAAQPMEAGLDNFIARERWENAAIQASNLSELYLTIGDVAQALAYAEQSVELADRSGDAFERMCDRTILADAQHQAGRLPEAEAAFREAEEMQKKNQPEFTLLYSLRGYQYCDLLLSQGNYAEVQRRAEKMFEWRLPSDSLLEIALENLSLGRAHLLQSQRDPNYPTTQLPNHPTTYFTRAVDGLRQAGHQEFIVSGLLARAEYYRVTGDRERAKRDLDEAFAIATRGGMGLHEADCHLEYARLALATPTPSLPRPDPSGQGREVAREHLATAKAMIAEMGYHRRDREVEELEARLRETA